MQPKNKLNKRKTKMISIFVVVSANQQKCNTCMCAHTRISSRVTKPKATDRNMMMALTKALNFSISFSHFCWSCLWKAWFSSDILVLLARI